MLRRRREALTMPFQKSAHVFSPASFAQQSRASLRLADCTDEWKADWSKCTFGGRVCVTRESPCVCDRTTPPEC